MISVGTRDARLGLGFGGGVEMEDTELEEGEACSSQINEYDSNIDPDVALSYIDDRIHDVLGHFQKDFEGGVSAENLGAKFGGYGSFLPTYQRSPVWSHPRTPPKVQNYSLLKSPNNLKLEDGHRNNVVCYSAPQSVGLGPSSTGSTSLVAPKAPSANDLLKQEVRMPFNQAEQYAPRHESANKKPTNLSDQKPLKVRIKVGSDNLSTRKNAILSGLGLDGTPSSSLDDSPSDSEGISHEPQDAPFESPTSILQIMTSFPVYEGMLLSPLPDDLIHLIEKEKLLKEGRSVPLPRDGLEKSGFLVNGTHTMEGGGKVAGTRKMKSVERNDFSAESKNGNNKDGIGVLSKKEQDIDTFACEELVSKTLKLPLLSNSFSTADDMKKSQEIDKNVSRDKVLPWQAENEPMEPTSNQEDDWVEKRKASLAGKVQEDRKVSSSDDVLVHPKKEGHRRGEKTYDSVKADSNVSKGRKALNTEVANYSKQKVNQKSTSHEVDDMRLLSGKEHPLTGEKKKSKESQRTVVAELPKESSRVGSSSVPKSRDTYRDFFGELEEESQMDALEFPSEDKLKDSDAVAKRTSAVNSSSKERPSGKKIDKLSTSDSHPITASNIDPRSGNGLISDAAPATGAPADRDSWVNCDKCLKWRLLPLGTNPDNLPEKWLCTMLNWLPGMNRCSVSEEETTEKTKALSAQYQAPVPENQSTAQYQAPVPESQSTLSNISGGFTEGVALAKVRNTEQNPQNFGLHGMPSGGKKKNGFKELSNGTNKDGSIQLSNSMKKNIQASAKSKSLNDVNQSPLLSEPDFQQLSKSSDMALEKRKHKYKEKHKVLEPFSVGGDIKNLKIKSRRDSDPNSSRASKKIKTEGKRITDEEWASDYSGAVGEVGPSSSSGFLTTAAGKDLIKDRLQAPSITKSKDEVFLDNGSLDVGNCDTGDGPKKRKMEEFQDTQICMGSLPTTGRHVQDRSVVVREEFSENDYRKGKKARVSKSEGKESSASKGSGRSDKKSNHIKNQQFGKDISNGLTCQSRNDRDSLKKDLGSAQASLAATSSSSKVSGSQKTKSSFQEVKGSPVESVSSSPMRISNADKLTAGRRDLMVKDEAQDAGHFATGSPRRCSDGEDDGGSDRSGTARRDKPSTVAYHGSIESSVLDFQNRDFSHISGGKARGQVVPSSDITNRLSMNSSLDNSGQDTRCPSKPLASNQFGDEDRENGSHYNANGSHPRKSGKGYSSRSKDKNGSFESDLDMSKAKNSNVLNELQDHSPSHEIKHRDGKNKLQEKFGTKSGEIENKYVSKKDFTGKSSNENSKRDGQSNFGGHDGLDVRVDAICKKDAISTPKQILLQDCDSERSSRRIPSEKTDRVDTGSIRGKSLPLPPSGGAQNEMMTRPRPVAGSHKGNRADNSQVDASEGNDAIKVIQTRKADSHNGTQHIGSRHLTQNGHRARDPDAPSPVRRDSSSQAFTNAVKEAKDLKHLADRFKNSGSVPESTGYYFQAALKFLHAASLLESSNSENAKHNEMTQSMQMYSSTAKLCEFCAHEYEKSKDMASAALAYKCMEVAYMRVIYSSHASASRDRLELQTALQMVLPGESPSSSASDVDNLNNPSTVDKIALPKGVSSPQVAGNHVIAARNRPNFLRMLNFTQDVYFAMEASRKSRIAFAAVNTNKGEAKYSESISSIKRALDFNFQDVEGLLRLVRLAMEMISR